MNRPLNAQLWDRSDDEFYIEPPWVTAALLREEGFQGGIWDPACGSGNIIKVFLGAGRYALGSDIIKRTNDEGWFIGTGDFLSCSDRFPGTFNIVMNPPYGRAKLAEAFIRKALSLKPEKLAVFVETRFLCGSRRAQGLFREHHPARVWLITPRPSCPPPGSYLEAGGKPEGGKQDYCWIVWTRPADPGPTQLLWLDCSGERGA